MDNFSIHANIGKREFILKEYSEDILEGGMEGRFAYSLNDRYSGFIKGVSFSGGLGFQIESVENTSDIILIDSYPQIIYITGGLYVEVSLYHNLKLLPTKVTGQKNINKRGAQYESILPCIRIM